MQVILVIACVMACTAALTLKGQRNAVDDRTPHLLVIENNPGEIEESVRKARQIYEDISVDIIQGKVFLFLEPQIFFDYLFKTLFV